MKPTSFFCFVFYYSRYISNYEAERSISCCAVYEREYSMMICNTLDDDCNMNGIINNTRCHTNQTYYRTNYMLHIVAVLGFKKGKIVIENVLLHNVDRTNYLY